MYSNYDFKEMKGNVFDKLTNNEQQVNAEHLYYAELYLYFIAKKIDNKLTLFDISSDVFPYRRENGINDIIKNRDKSYFWPVLSKVDKQIDYVKERGRESLIKIERYFDATIENITLNITENSNIINIEPYIKSFNKCYEVLVLLVIHRLIYNQIFPEMEIRTYKTLQDIIDAVSEGVIDPASITVPVNRYQSGYFIAPIKYDFIVYINDLHKARYFPQDYENYLSKENYISQIDKITEGLDKYVKKIYNVFNSSVKKIFENRELFENFYKKNNYEIFKIFNLTNYKSYLELFIPSIVLKDIYISKFDIFNNNSVENNFKNYKHNNKFIYTYPENEYILEIFNETENIYFDGQRSGYSYYNDILTDYEFNNIGVIPFGLSREGDKYQPPDIKSCMFLNKIFRISTMVAIDRLLYGMTLKQINLYSYINNYKPTDIFSYELSEKDTTVDKKSNKINYISLLTIGKYNFERKSLFTNIVDKDIFIEEPNLTNIKNLENFRYYQQKTKEDIISNILLTTLFYQFMLIYVNEKNVSYEVYNKVVNYYKDNTSVYNNIIKHRKEIITNNRANNEIIVPYKFLISNDNNQSYLDNSIIPYINSLMGVNNPRFLNIKDKSSRIIVYLEEYLINSVLKFYYGIYVNPKISKTRINKLDISKYQAILDKEDIILNMLDDDNAKKNIFKALEVVINYKTKSLDKAKNAFKIFILLSLMLITSNSISMFLLYAEIYLNTLSLNDLKTVLCKILNLENCQAIFDKKELLEFSFKIFKDKNNFSKVIFKDKLIDMLYILYKTNNNTTKYTIKNSVEQNKKYIDIIKEKLELLGINTKYITGNSIAANLNRENSITEDYIESVLLKIKDNNYEPTSVFSLKRTQRESSRIASKKISDLTIKSKRETKK